MADELEKRIATLEREHGPRQHEITIYHRVVSTRIDRITGEKREVILEPVAYEFSPWGDWVNGTRIRQATGIYANDHGTKGQQSDTSACRNQKINDMR